MAITNTIIDRSKFGDKEVVWGKSVISGGTNTGDVATGLAYVEMFIPTTAGSAQKGIAVNETLPLSSGDVTIVMESNDGTAYWFAIGH